MKLQQVQQIQVSKNNKELWKYCDDICFKSKNLYNYANYIVRQEFINNRKWIRNYDLDALCKQQDCYKALPSQTAQQVLKLIDKNWKSFFSAIKDYGKNKSNYSGRPKLPKYKHKENGRNVTIFNSQQRKIKNGFYRFPKSDIGFKTTITNEQLCQIRIVPQATCYTIEVIYAIEVSEITHDSNRIASIDLGLSNLVTMTNNIGEQPIVINGKIIKSVNQYYNKKLARLKSIAEISNKRKTTARIQKLTLKRNNKVKDLLHKTSRFIINYLIKNNINTLVIGNNKNWKQDINIGKVNNQKFVSIPYSTLISQLQYKGLKVGIKVIVTEESYTSKASFLDNDVMPVFKANNDTTHTFSGKRIKRGLYRSKQGVYINADVNGSYNIGRKVFPNAFTFKVDGIEGIGLYPVKFNIA